MGVWVTQVWWCLLVRVEKDAMIALPLVLPLPLPSCLSFSTARPSGFRHLRGPLTPPFPVALDLNHREDGTGVPAGLQNQ